MSNVEEAEILSQKSEPTPPQPEKVTSEPEEIEEEEDLADDVNDLKQLNEEERNKEKIRQKREYLEDNKPKFEDLSAHALYFEKKNLKNLMLCDFRQFNKERLQGDFVVIQINSDFPYQMHKIHNPPDENFRMEVENMPNQELKELPEDIFNPEENGITWKEAEEIFLRLIESSYEFHLKEKFYKLLFEAFKESFNELKDFDLYSDEIYTTRMKKMGKVEEETGLTDDTKKLNKKKIIFGGGAYEYVPSTDEWERTTSNTGDFLGLIRQLMNILMGFQGIITREFVTSDGMFIVNVCYGHQFNMKMVAEYLRMKKFLDIAFVDLMSMEPIDSKRRPLRLNAALHDEGLWQVMYGKDTRGLRSSIKEKLSEINYKKMIREIDGIWDKDMIKEENARVQIYNHAKIPLSEWTEYEKYLSQLLERVVEIRRDHTIKMKKLPIQEKEKFMGEPDFGELVRNVLMKTTEEEIDKKERLVQALKNNLGDPEFPEEDKKLIRLILEFIKRRVKKKGDRTIVEMAKKKSQSPDNQNEVPIQKVQALKDGMVWMDRKKIKYRKQLSDKYFEAMKDSYEGASILRNKWMIWGQRPIGGFRIFSFQRNKQRKRIKDFNDLLWKQYQMTSSKKVVLDEFEKMRIMDFQLNKMIQMGELSTMFADIFEKF